MKNLVFLMFFSFGSLNQLQAQWMQTSLINASIKSFTVSPNGSGGTNLFAGSSGDGIFLSTDNGISWSNVNNGLTNTNINTLAAIPDGMGGTNIFAGTEGGDVFLSTNNGFNWTAVNNGLPNSPVRAFAFNPTGTGGINIFAGTAGGGVFLSSNNGLSWTAVNNDLMNTYILTLTAGQPGQSDIFAGTFGSGVFLSTNNGANWTSVNSGLTNGNIFTLAVYSDETVSAKLFAGTLGGGAFLSTDNGSNWLQINSGLTNDNVRVFAFSPNGSAGTNLFAGTVGGVFHSTNNGTSWVNINDGLPDVFVLNLIISSDETETYNLFASIQGAGVWKRPLDNIIPVALTSFTASVIGADVQLKWSTATETNNSGFEIERAPSLSPPKGENPKGWETVGFVEGNGTTTKTNFYSFIDGKVKPGSYLYRLKQIDFDGTFEYSHIIEVDILSPNDFYLSQNYPNPFNPATKIRFQIPESIFPQGVRLVIFDALGREVATLIDEEVKPGNYEVTWNAAGFPAGVYYYKMNTDFFSDVKKLLLIK